MKTIKLTDIGVQVLPRSAWPQEIFLAYESRKVLIPDVTKLHTTQDLVDMRIVDVKQKEILEGTPLRVEIFQDNQNRIWILDGHHTLVAYLRLGKTPKGAVYGRGPIPLPRPPRFRRN